MRKLLGEPAYQAPSSSTADQAASTGSTAAQHATTSFLALLNQKMAASGTSQSASTVADGQKWISEHLAGAGTQMTGNLINDIA